MVTLSQRLRGGQEQGRKEKGGRKRREAGPIPATGRMIQLAGVERRGSKLLHLFLMAWGFSSSENP